MIPVETEETPALTMYRPVGPDELTLIKDSGFREFPPPLSAAANFLWVVTSVDYAHEIAEGWLACREGSAVVVEFSVHKDFITRNQNRMRSDARGSVLWIPREDIDDFNLHLLGDIRCHLAAHHRGL